MAFAMLVPSDVNAAMYQKQENVGFSENRAISKDGITIKKFGKSKQERNLRRDGNGYDNHTPNTALGLSNEYLGPTLNDYATSDENWYYFQVSENDKITVILEQPSDGDYDIYLYKLSDVNLNLVAYSVYRGSIMDRLSYVVDEDGYYFLNVVPQTASVTENAVYYFVIRLDTNYDSYEGNDNINQAGTSFNNSVSLMGTIDNVFDTDFYTFVVPNTGYYKLRLSNVPSTAEYTAAIYNSSLNVVGEVVSTGDNSTFVNLNAGTYYIDVYSSNYQYNYTQNYKLELYPVHSVNSTFYTTHGGHLVELTPSAVYIDGVAANMNWTFTYNINYTRIQQLTITNNTKVDASSYKNGSFVDAQNIHSSNDCIKVKINNFNYYYYCNSPYETYTTPYGENPYYYIYIDANTGQTIGTDVDIYLTWSGFHYTFNEY